MPKIWTKTDMPVPSNMAEYLNQVQGVRNAAGVPWGTPEIPANMDNLTYQTANDLERILLAVRGTVERIPKSWIYSGEFRAGGF